jgi:hypothetical protein
VNGDTFEVSETVPVSCTALTLLMVPDELACVPAPNAQFWITPPRVFPVMSIP